MEMKTGPASKLLNILLFKKQIMYKKSPFTIICIYAHKRENSAEL
jgi:hypothetical protein